MPLKAVALPYFHYSSTAPEYLSQEAESAAIIGFSETGRRRKGFLSGVEEQLKCVAMLRYPVYAYQWRNGTLLLKPFSSAGTGLKYGVTLDFHRFLGEVRRTSSDRSEYTEFLAENIKLFAKYSKVRTIDFGEFISNNKLASELLGEAKKQRVMEKVAEGLIPVSVDEEKRKQSVERFEELWRNMQIDLDNLSSVTKILDRELDKHTSKIEVELNLVEESADKEIEENMPSIRKVVKKLERERDTAIRQIEKSRRRELSALSRTKTKLENELRRRRQQEARFEREKERKKSRGDTHGARFWGKELTKCRREISGLESDLRRCEKKMEKLMSQFATEVGEIKNRYAEDIRFERQKITDIENRRDQDIKALKESIARLAEYTAKITRDIAKQAENKKLEIETLEDVAAPIKIEGPLAIYLPIYLTRYTSKNEVRYEVISPVKVDISKTTLSAVKRRLVGLDGRLSDMLKPFSKELSNLIGGDITSRLSSDAAFAANVDKESAKLNILTNERFSDILDEGFRELVERGLLSRSETSKIKRQRGHWR